MRICAHCKYYKEYRLEYPLHRCQADIRTVPDPVTGEHRIIGEINCYEKNRLGTCEDYEEREARL